MLTTLNFFSYPIPFQNVPLVNLKFINFFFYLATFEETSRNLDGEFCIICFCCLLVYKKISYLLVSLHFFKSYCYFLTVSNYIYRSSVTILWARIVVVIVVEISVVVAVAVAVIAVIIILVIVMMILSKLFFILHGFCFICS